MPTEKDDESLGLEQLPQTELDSVPGAGEQPDPDTDKMFRNNSANAEAEKPGSVKPSTDDAQAE
ncbi:MULTISPECIES: hypothetical protein [unclassified Leptolyngbya]|uniref:hypothetical protein n=1 Tax=unclassified Leptolyngbya TaxID=2650499 RepID=UPI0016895925|nr:MULTISPECIES: hypothetical protein [unclassified Leptolyngbya]MBD1909402.1 hypothetical protein [Leptolyngbya sp. FACHB-8]MBD2157119.1 hypothetical protein [Leptolyngbya sp. FACHB-16]